MKFGIISELHPEVADSSSAGSTIYAFEVHVEEHSLGTGEAVGFDSHQRLHF